MTFNWPVRSLSPIPKSRGRSSLHPPPREITKGKLCLKPTALCKTDLKTWRHWKKKKKESKEKKQTNEQWLQKEPNSFAWAVLSLHTESENPSLEMNWEQGSIHQYSRFKDDFSPTCRSIKLWVDGKMLYLSVWCNYLERCLKIPQYKQYTHWVELKFQNSYQRCLFICFCFLANSNFDPGLLRINEVQRQRWFL